MKINHAILTLLFSLVLIVSTTAGAKVRVVASTTDLASITEMIGGNNVKVQSIVSGKSDPHFVELLPSYMVKVAKADIYLKVGMDLDYWSNQIIDGSGNGKLLIIDCSKNIEPLEVPTTKVDASMGDVHVQGNPHYWLSPHNGLVIARQITDALSQVDPENSGAYDAGLEGFQAKMEAKVAEWKSRAEPIRGKQIITYHNSWPYFSEAFGIEIAGFVEPKPGIEPTPSHTAQLISLANSQGIKVIGKEPYFSDRAPKTIARQSNAKVVDLPPSVGGAKGTDDYLSLFDVLLDILTTELEE